MSRHLVLEADGGSRGNPGPAGYGAVLRDAATGVVVAEVAAGIGVASNNVAEYRGLIAGLTKALEVGADEVDVRMDSLLVVNQMTSVWKVKHEAMKPLASEAAALVRQFRRVGFRHVPREQNRHADRLANEAMDAAAGGKVWAPPADRAGALASSTGSVEVPEPEPEPAATPAPATRPAYGWGAPRGAATVTWLLRHGETALSAERRFSGVGDPDLTERGHAQAQAAAARLAGRGVEVVVASPRRRARQTAAAVVAATGAELVVEDGFAETDFGAWEGRTFAEVQAQWPQEMQAWLAGPDVAPPDGESFTATFARVRAARERLVAAHPGRTVVVVSHVTPIKAMVRDALEAPPQALYRLHLDPASLSLVDWYADGRGVVRLVNDTAHLDNGLLTTAR